jgi:hypothetical protein
MVRGWTGIWGDGGVSGCSWATFCRCTYRDELPSVPRRVIVVLTIVMVLVWRHGREGFRQVEGLRGNLPEES